MFTLISTSLVRVQISHIKVDFHFLFVFLVEFYSIHLLVYFYYYFKLKYSWCTLLYKFYVCHIVIWHWHTLWNDHHDFSSNHLSHYKVITILLTIFPMLYIMFLWLTYFIPGGFYFFIFIICFPHPYSLPSDSHSFVLCIYLFIFFIYFY